jgi:hypothetical protein
VISIVAFIAQKPVPPPPPPPAPAAPLPKTKLKPPPPPPPPPLPKTKLAPPLPKIEVVPVKDYGEQYVAPRPLVFAVELSPVIDPGYQELDKVGPLVEQQGG